MIVSTFALASLLSLSGTQQPPPQVERLCSIHGSVVDQLAEPVPAADVWITEWRATDVVLARSQSDASGQFKMGQVPERDAWRLRATHGGKAVIAQLLRPLDEPPVIKLIDAVTLRGIVLDRAGNPVAGAPASASLVNTPGSFMVEDSTTTGPDGRFAMRRVPLGLVSLRAFVRGEGNAEQRLQVSGEAEVTLAPGSDAKISVEVEVSGLPATTSSGVVSITQVGATHSRDAWETISFARDGKYTFGPLTDETYFVVARHPDVVFSLGDNLVKKGDPPRLIRLQASPKSPWSLQGTLHGSNGKPLGGLRLVLLQQESRSTETVTRADGTFCIQTHGAKGEGCLVYTPDDAWVLDRKDNSDSKRISDLSDWRVTVGRPFSAEADTRLELQASPSYVVSGRVVGPDARPVPGVRVELQDQQENRTPKWFPQSYAVTDDEGRFRMSHLRKLASEVRLSVQCIAGQASSTLFSLGDAGTVLMRPDLRLEAACIVEGVVTGDDGKPVPGAAVRLCDTMSPIAFMGLVAKSHFASADRSGRFRFLGVPPGKWYMRAVDADGQQPQTTLTLKAGERLQTDIEFKLSK